MNTEQPAASTTVSRRLGVLASVLAAIVVFRVCTVLLGFGQYLLSGASWVPLFVQSFVYRFDTVIVSGLAIVAAVLSARWAEAKLAKHRRRLAVFVCLVFAPLAFVPITAHLRVTGAMDSPFLVAMHNDHSVETLEAILDRYPHLANASYDEPAHRQPLVEAAYEGRTNVVQLLIRKGADVDAAVEALVMLDTEEPLKLVLTSADRDGQDHPIETNR